MQNPDEWIGTLPDGIFWNEQSDKIYFNWNPDGDTLSSLYCYALKTDEIEKVATEEKIKLPGRYGRYNADKTQKVYTRNGNIFLYDVKTAKEKQLTSWLGNARSPRFEQNDTGISFLKDNKMCSDDNNDLTGINAYNFSTDMPPPGPWPIRTF